MLRVLRMKTVILVLLFTTLSACGASQPTRYYLLTDIKSQIQSTPQSTELTIGVGPVIVPSYLERRELVSRDNSNKLNVAVYHEWAEPFQENVNRIIGENLARRLGTHRIYHLPVKRSLRHSLTIDYQLAVDFNTFEKQAEGEVVLNARWTILDSDKNELIIRQSEYSQMPPGDDYTSQVATQSQLLGRLSDEIAETVVKLASKQP